MSRHIAYEALLKHAGDILARGFGYSEEEARITARVLVEADARGIPSHGVSRLAFYRVNLSQGHARPGAEPEVVWRTPCSIVVDGHDGVGCYITDWSVRKMLELAESSGTAYCAVRNSNHYGIAGLWAEEIARHDMIGMAFTNSYIAGTPTFGRRRILGTNPIAVGVPEAGGRVFLLDMATTTVAHGKVELYDRRRKPMPQGWVIDENGCGVTDATAFEKVFYDGKFGGHLFLGGEGEETGGHKGFGLGLLVELLCSGLSLGASSLNTFPKGGGGGITHFFSAMKLDLFGDPTALKTHIGGIIDDIRQSEKIAGHDRIFIHGEKEAESRARAMKEGVYLDDATCSYLAGLAKEFGLTELKGLSQCAA
ncbi:MAG: Ldh family oxidoreductase [Candidatus Adiutrix sp.]|jgi:LDH2 family malate/lactate/ureidoglycolate dehydrogenase|nr:Ldh family oxidoreductase [Candidatus Adiutrix sp.]